MVRLTLAYLLTFAALATIALLSAPARGAANPLDRSGHAFHHPSGVTIPMPSGWTTQAHAGITLLVPPGGMGQTEAYLMVITSIPGASRADDPIAGRLLEEEVAQLSSSLRRDGRSDPFQTTSGAPAAAHAFVGTNEQGQAIRARAYLVLGDRFAVAVFAVGKKPQVDARDAEVRRMLSQLSFGQGRRDRSLVGHWKYVHTSSYTSGEFTAATEVRRELWLAADGRCASRESSRAIGGDMNASVDSGEDAASERGTWYAADGAACMILDTGQGAIGAQYTLSGDPGRRTLTITTVAGRQVYHEQ
jgi:hypothetical protein